MEKLRKLLPERHRVIGAYAYSAIVEPRETQDIDILLTRRDARALAKKLVADEADVSAREHEMVIRIHQGAPARIDLIFCDVHPLPRAVLDDPGVARTIPRFGRAKTPSVEALIALKYHAACSPTRGRVKKLQDLHDMFAYLAGAKRLDEVRLAGYLGRISPSAGADFAKLRADFEGGRPIAF